MPYHPMPPHRPRRGPDAPKPGDEPFPDQAQDPIGAHVTTGPADGMVVPGSILRTPCQTPLPRAAGNDPASAASFEYQ